MKKYVIRLNIKILYMSVYEYINFDHSIDNCE